MLKIKKRPRPPFFIVKFVLPDFGKTFNTFGTEHFAHAFPIFINRDFLKICFKFSICCSH